MNYKKYGLIITCIFNLADESLATSQLNDEQVDALVHQCNRAIKKAETPESKADLIVRLKVDLANSKEPTQSLSDAAIALYKMQEIHLAKGFDPMDTPIEYFVKMDYKAFQTYYSEYVDTYIQEHERLLKLREIANLYKKIADVHHLDGDILNADKYYMMSANLIVDGLYDYGDTAYLASTLRRARDLLKKTSIYGSETRPLVAWVFDNFHFKQMDMAHKVFNFILCTDVEPVSANELLKASYCSWIDEDKPKVDIYYSYAQVKMQGAEPMRDRSIYLKAHRFANYLAIDILKILFQEQQLVPNHRVLIPKWSEFLHGQKFVFQVPLQTIVGAIDPSDLEDAERLYRKIRELHLENVSREPRA